MLDGYTASLLLQEIALNASWLAWAVLCPEDDLHLCKFVIFIPVQPLISGKLIIPPNPPFLSYLYQLYTRYIWTPFSKLFLFNSTIKWSYMAYVRIYIVKLTTCTCGLFHLYLKYPDQFFKYNFFWKKDKT